MASSTRPTRARCTSAAHVAVPAVVAGTFDSRHVNGREPSDATYCLRCAVLLEFGGLFTPEQALAPLPDVATAYAGKITASWTAADQEAEIATAAPRTVALLRNFPAVS